VAALNTANAIGAWGGGIAINAGRSVLTAAWAGFALTSAGLLLYLATLQRKVWQQHSSPAQPK